MKRILSIDWDYFVDVNDNFRILNFPDGNNRLSPMIQNLIWSGKYSTEWDKTVGVLEKDLRIVEDVVINYVIRNSFGEHTQTPITLNTEHCGIMKFLDEVFPNERYTIVNIDFHHDAFYKGSAEEVHCGNWLTHLHKECRLDKAIWIRHAKHHTHAEKLKKWIDLDNIDMIKGVNFDGIFICHSPAWSPPHLDAKFREVFRHMFNAKQFDAGFPDRWNDDMKNAIQAHRSLIEDMQKDFKQKVIDSIPKEEIADAITKLQEVNNEKTMSDNANESN